MPIPAEREELEEDKRPAPPCPFVEAGGDLVDLVGLEGAVARDASCTIEERVVWVSAGRADLEEREWDIRPAPSCPLLEAGGDFVDLVGLEGDARLRPAVHRFFVGFGGGSKNLSAFLIFFLSLEVSLIFSVARRTEAAVGTASA